MCRAIVWGALAVGAFLLLTKDGPRTVPGPFPGARLPQHFNLGPVAVTGVQGAGVDIGSGLESQGSA